MPMFSECCTQGDDNFPVDMFCCQVCGQSRCSGCQYGDRIDLTNITGYKGKGNVCKKCLKAVTPVAGVGQAVRAGAKSIDIPQHPIRGYQAGQVTGIASKGLSKGKLKPAYSETQAIIELGKLDYERTFGNEKVPGYRVEQKDETDWELQSELRNQGIMNDPEPICCPKCQGELRATGGMVGEKVLYCEIDGIVWEDHEDAIRRVI